MNWFEEQRFVMLRRKSLITRAKSRGGLSPGCCCPVGMGHPWGKKGRIETAAGSHTGADGALRAGLPSEHVVAKTRVGQGQSRQPAPCSAYLASQDPGVGAAWAGSALVCAECRWLSELEVCQVQICRDVLLVLGLAVLLKS